MRVLAGRLRKSAKSAGVNIHTLLLEFIELRLRWLWNPILIKLFLRRLHSFSSSSRYRIGNNEFVILFPLQYVQLPDPNGIHPCPSDIYRKSREGFAMSPPLALFSSIVLAAVIPFFFSRVWLPRCAEPPQPDWVLTVANTKPACSWHPAPSLTIAFFRLLLFF